MTHTKKNWNIWQPTFDTFKEVQTPNQVEQGFSISFSIETNETNIWM